jgi:cystathionine beta-lyase/cystathionine gamma-synthase
MIHTPTWYNEWSRKRNEIITPENFTPEEKIKEIVNSLDEKLRNIVDVPIINQTITEEKYIEDVISGKIQGDYYIRNGHQNFTQVEKIKELLETGALAHPEYFVCRSFNTGMSAINTILKAIASDHKTGTFIRGKTVYPSSADILSDIGNGKNIIGTKPAIPLDLTNPENLENILKKRKNIIGVFFEAIENPTLNFNDIRKISEIAHKYNIPVIVDNTFAPYIYEPFRAGADVVVYSGSKVHTGDGKMSFGFSIHPAELDLKIWKLRKIMGTTPSIKDAYEMVQKLPSYPERMMKHCENARRIAEALVEENGIEMKYKDLPGITRNGFGGMIVTFEIVDSDPEKAYAKAAHFGTFLREKKNKHIRYAVSFGMEETLCFVMADQFTYKTLTSMDVPPGTVRVSAGRGDVNKTIEFLKEAYNHALK